MKAASTPKITVSLQKHDRAGPHTPVISQGQYRWHDMTGHTTTEVNPPGWPGSAQQGHPAGDKVQPSKLQG